MSVFGLPWQDAAMIHGRAALGVFGCPFWRFLGTKLSDIITVARLTAIEGPEELTELRELYLSHTVIENAHGLESQVSGEDCW